MKRENPTVFLSLYNYIFYYIKKRRVLQKSPVIYCCLSEKNIIKSVTELPYRNIIYPYGEVWLHFFV